MWLDQFLPPPGTHCAIEHGRQHSGTPEQRAREWQRLQAQGVAQGTEDYQILYRGLFLAIEFKHGRNPQSFHQKRREEAVKANGFSYYVIRSVEGLATVLHQHGVPLALAAAQVATEYDAALLRERPYKAAAPKRRALNKRAAANKLAAMDRARRAGVFV